MQQILLSGVEGLSEFNDELRKLCIEMMPIYVGKAHDKRWTKISSKPVPKEKTDQPVGDLDHYAMERFRELILSKFPLHHTIGEEDKKNAEEMARIMADPNGFYWSIDGLDGTWHYEARTNSFGAMIALRRGGRIIFAMIFRPNDMKLRGHGYFYAAEGEGAWEWCGCEDCGGPDSEGTWERLHATTIDPEKPRRLTTMLEGSSKRFYGNPIRRIGKTTTTRGSLSSCIAVTTLGLGSREARGMLTEGHEPWDSWPLQLFARELGCSVDDRKGNPATATKSGSLVITATPEDKAYVFEKMRPPKRKKKPTKKKQPIKKRGR